MKKATIYLGNSLKDFNEIQMLLAQNKIKYKYQIIDHETAMMSPGHGCGRTISAINYNAEQSNKMYEIWVHKKDAEYAKMLLQKKH